MTTVYQLLRLRCGLSQQEAADFHGVRLDTIKSWDTDRREAPPGAIAELKGLYRDIVVAGDVLASEIRNRDLVYDVDSLKHVIGLPQDANEARACGWPCLGACAAAVSVAIAQLEEPVRLVSWVRGRVLTAVMQDFMPKQDGRARPESRDHMSAGGQVYVPSGPGTGRRR